MICIVKATGTANAYIREVECVPPKGMEFEVTEQRYDELRHSEYGPLVEFVDYKEEQLPLMLGLVGDGLRPGRRK